MANKPFIPVILGTARVGRQSEKIAQYVLESVEKHGDIETQLVDVKEFVGTHTIPPWENNDATKPWRDIVKKAQGFIIVTPEYNHGYPGELKMLLDQGAKEDYAGKPVLLCGVSAGPFGGARVIENLLSVTRELGLFALSASLYFPNVGELIKLSSEDLAKQYQERTAKALQALSGYLTKK